MKTSSKFAIRTLLAAAGVAVVMGGIAAAPASAEEWHHGREARVEHLRHEEAWRRHERFEHRPYYGYRGYAYGAPSLRFVLPLG